MPLNPNDYEQDALEGGSAPDAAASGTAGHEDENAPFIVGSEAGDDAFGVSGEEDASSNRYSGALLIVLVVAIAAAGLFSMRTLSRVSAAGDMNSDLEMTIEAFLKGASGAGADNDNTSVSELVERNQQVLDVIRNSDLNRQTSALDLQRNPFIIESLRAISEEVDESTPADQAGAIREQKRKQREAQLTQAIKQVRIKSILMGSQPLANIGNKVVTEGDVIDLKVDGATFRVVNIQSAAITIEGTDQALDVSVQIDVQLRRR